MKKAPTRQDRFVRIARHRHLLPLVAAGGGLAAGPVNALELGDAVVQSRLGQPLRASIAYALAPNEEISDNCLSLGRAPSGLPGIGRTTLRVADGRILLSGQTPLREPMVGARLIVNCPYTANLSRDYMMFIDPVELANETAPAAASVAAVTATAPRQTAAPADKRQAIGNSTRYRVQPGDSLSIIAQRIENRPVGLWPAVNAIFAANPDAFLDDDPNRLKAGSWLEIPSFDGSEPVIAPASRLAKPAPQLTAYKGIEEETSQQAAYSGFEEEASQQAAYSGFEETISRQAPEQAADVETSTVLQTEAPVANVIESPVLNEITDATSDLRPGDIILDDATIATAVVEEIVIPDTALDGPETTSSSPNVPTAVIDTSGAAQPPGSSWLLWTAGGGLALIFALLLYGFRLRRRPAPMGAMGQPGEIETEDTESIQALVDDEYDLDDDSPTAENLALDADLFAGTGLDQGTDMDVADDLGFSSPTEVDIELPPEPEATAVTTETDIIPPVHTDGHSILESEILPDDDDYDMSVIVDATKMPRPEDVTERDLQAVEIDPADNDVTTDSYTIDREADFDILEQDYEDELTATQALNKEIARAAAELAELVTDEKEGTSEMPLATVTELDVTAQMQRGDEARDQDDTVESESPTVNTSRDEDTAEMLTANDEDTVELDGSKVGSRNA